MNDRWRMFGKYFGYPQCCIDDFCSRERLADANSDQQFIASFQTGFVPCPSCTEKVMKREVAIGDLIQNRECKLPFPDQPSYKKMEVWLRKQLDKYE